MKKALITGAGRGIGRATAIALSGMGYEIYANYVGNTKAAEETKTLIEQNGGVCTLVKYDLCKADCAEKLYEMTGNVDALVLNASIQFRKKWNEITPEEYETQMNCNFRATALDAL